MPTHVPPFLYVQLPLVKNLESATVNMAALELHTNINNTLFFLQISEADKYCASYCDQQDVKADGFYCKDTEFCCGSLRTRYCCNNSTLDISDKYPKNVSICSNTAWLIYQ